ALSSLTSICDTTNATDLPSGAHCGSRTSFRRPRSSREIGRLAPCAAARPTAARTMTHAYRIRFIDVSSSLRIDCRGNLVPNLDLVTIRIGGKQIGLAGHELALFLHDAAGFLDRARRGADVLGILQSEP